MLHSDLRRVRSPVISIGGGVRSCVSHRLVSKTINNSFTNEDRLSQNLEEKGVDMKSLRKFLKPKSF